MENIFDQAQCFLNAAKKCVCDVAVFKMQCVCLSSVEFFPRFREVTKLEIVLEHKRKVFKVRIAFSC